MEKGLDAFPKKRYAGATVADVDVVGTVQVGVLCGRMRR